MGFLTKIFSLFLSKLYNLKLTKLFPLFFIFIAFGSMGQEVHILDSKEHEYVSDVFIIGKSGTAISNLQGKADITQLLIDSDTLVFQHPAFEVYQISTKELHKEKYAVYLIRKVIALEEFTISANKWEQKADELPLRVKSINRDALFFQPATTADLIGGTGEVYIQKSQQGGGSPMFRGFAANRILLVYDGVRVNNAIFRSGNLQNIILFDANAMESAEIVFGPGSTIYGSDALGGVIDFRTLNAEFARDSNDIFYGQAKAGYASASNEINGHFHFAYGSDKFSSLTSLSYASFGDLKMGANGPDDYLRPYYAGRINNKDTLIANDNPKKQIPSGYRQFNLVQKFGFKIKDHSKILLGINYATTNDIPRYDRLIIKTDDGLKYAEWFYGPQGWLNINLSFANNKKTSISDEYRITLAYQNMKESRHDRKFDQLLRRNRFEIVDMLSLNADFNKIFNTHFQLFYGTELFGNLVGSTANKENIETLESVPDATRYPDGSTYGSAGVYAMLKYKPVDSWILDFGLRYSYFNLQGTFDTTFYNFPDKGFDQATSALTPTFGIVFKATDKIRLFANIGTGFRAPNIDDMAKVFDSSPGRVVVPNIDLQPENTISFDLGLTWTPSKKFQLEASGFYTILQNLMVKVPFTVNGSDSIFYDGELSAVEAIQNVGSGWIAGAQGSFMAILSERFSLKGSLVYTKGKEENGDALRHVTPLFGVLHIEYLDKHFRIDLNTRINGSITYNNLAPSERDKPYLYATDSNGNPHSPSWYLININASWFISDAVRLVVGVDNILNKRYRSYSSGIAGAGTNFLGSVVVHF
jgi:hemoglobin/transferrin/lactoferrin receptor protein